jgi:hypothetical protein
MQRPKELVERLERAAELPGGEGERFAGYGVMGMPFASGHILGLRRFPASSLGPGYASVWHRDPEDRWTFYQDVAPEQACSRYFGKALEESRVSRIEVAWSSARELVVAVDGGSTLRWQISLAETPGTRLMNVVGGLLPEALWHHPGTLQRMGKVAGLVLGTGQLSLTGQAPNGQRFVAQPRLIWMVSSSTAAVNGQALGPMGPLPAQAKLGDFWIPQRGIFAVVHAVLDAFDPARHVASVSRERQRVAG